MQHHGGFLDDRWSSAYVVGYYVAQRQAAAQVRGATAPLAPAPPARPPRLLVDLWIWALERGIAGLDRLENWLVRLEQRRHRA